MKYFFLLTIFFLIFRTNAKDYEVVFTSTGSFTNDEIVFLDKSKVSHNKYDSEWTDNYGNFGTAYCITSIKYNTKEVITELDSYCRYVDQQGNLFTQHNSRKGNQLNAGVGKAIFIEGQKKWKYLKGSTCLYSIKYLDDRTYSIRKCKITEEMHDYLSKE